MIEDALVIIPAFNEAPVLAETLGELRGDARRLWVVDDGSQDETSRIARESGAGCLRLATNLNYGGALQAGVRFGLRQTAVPYFLTFDADGPQPPTGLRGLTREAARMFLSPLFPQDYPDADVLIMLARMGFRIREVPGRMRPSRRRGSLD